MKNQKSKTSGFTLVELLIVITIIGVLAGTVFAALNPLERTRRAQDARAVSAAKEAVDACERYLSAGGALACPICNDLITAGELKTGGCTYVGSITCSAAGSCTANTTATIRSAYYTAVTRCNGNVCTVPTETTGL